MQRSGAPRAGSLFDAIAADLSAHAHTLATHIEKALRAEASGGGPILSAVEPASRWRGGPSVRLLADASASALHARRAAPPSPSLALLLPAAAADPTADADAADAAAEPCAVLWATERFPPCSLMPVTDCVAELCTARRRRQLQELCFGTNAWLSLLATQLVDCLQQLERCGALPPDPKLAKEGA